MCNAIYIGNTQQTFKKIMDGRFFNLLRPLKNGQKSDSFAAHYKQYFKSTASHTYLCKCMIFKVVKHLNLICSIKTFSKPNCNLCMEEHITILKKLRDKHVMVMKNNLDIYGACWHKTTFSQFVLITYDPI